jgi:hypothetical protein
MAKDSLICARDRGRGQGTGQERRSPADGSVWPECRATRPELRWPGRSAGGLARTAAMRLVPLVRGRSSFRREERPARSGGGEPHSQYWAGVVVWLRWPGVVQVRVPGLGVVRVQPGTCLVWWSWRQAGIGLHSQQTPAGAALVAERLGPGYAAIAADRLHYWVLSSFPGCDRAAIRAGLTASTLAAAMNPAASPARSQTHGTSGPTVLRLWVIFFRCVITQAAA